MTSISWSVNTMGAPSLSPRLEQLAEVSRRVDDTPAETWDPFKDEGSVIWTRDDGSFLLVKGCGELSVWDPQTKQMVAMAQVPNMHQWAGGLLRSVLPDVEVVGMTVLFTGSDGRVPRRLTPETYEQAFQTKETDR